MSELPCLSVILSAIGLLQALSGFRPPCRKTPLPHQTELLSKSYLCSHLDFFLTFYTSCYFQLPSKVYILINLETWKFAHCPPMTCRRLQPQLQALKLAASPLIKLIRHSNPSIRVRPPYCTTSIQLPCTSPKLFRKASPNQSSRPDLRTPGLANSLLQRRMVRLSLEPTHSHTPDPQTGRLHPRRRLV